MISITISTILSKSPVSWPPLWPPPRPFRSSQPNAGGVHLCLSPLTLRLRGMGMGGGGGGGGAREQFISPTAFSGIFSLGWRVVSPMQIMYTMGIQRRFVYHVHVYKIVRPS